MLGGGREEGSHVMQQACGSSLRLQIAVAGIGKQWLYQLSCVAFKTEAVTHMLACFSLGRLIKGMIAAALPPAVFVGSPPPVPTWWLNVMWLTPCWCR